MNKLEAIIFNLNELNKKYKMQQEEYKSKKAFYESQISKAYGKRNIKFHKFKDSGLFYKATFVQPKKVNFNVDMVEQILDKELFNEICDKSYTIIDYNGMVKYLKSLGADPKVFKSFIHCEKAINKNKVDQLGNLGDLSMDDLEGCYTVSDGTSYVKITTSEEEIVDDEDS